LRQLLAASPDCRWQSGQSKEKEGTTMLCSNCQGKKFIANTGTCKGCGGMTKSGQFKLCPRCAFVKNECAACGAKLSTPAAKHRQP
jgi:hypothetical protein